MARFSGQLDVRERTDVSLVVSWLAGLIVDLIFKISYLGNVTVKVWFENTNLTSLSLLIPNKNGPNNLLMRKKTVHPKCKKKKELRLEEIREPGATHQGENLYLTEPSRGLRFEKFLTDPFQFSIMDRDLSL